VADNVLEGLVVLRTDHLAISLQPFSKRYAALLRGHVRGVRWHKLIPAHSADGMAISLGKSPSLGCLPLSCRNDFDRGRRAVKQLYVKQLRRWVTGYCPTSGPLAGSSDTQSDQQSGEHIHITGLILPASSAGGRSKRHPVSIDDDL
jgi:hypothetical protein